MPTLINLMSNYFIPRVSYRNLPFSKEMKPTCERIQRGRKRSPPPKNRRDTNSSI